MTAQGRAALLGSGIFSGRKSSRICIYAKEEAQSAVVRPVVMTMEDTGTPLPGQQIL